MIRSTEVCGTDTGLPCKRSFPLLQFQDNAMDLWGFKKWRRKLGYTQVEAGEKLGLSRGAVQYWESESRPVPLAVELACQELLRLWKQRPEFGPVTLLYADYTDDPRQHPRAVRATSEQRKRLEERRSAEGDHDPFFVALRCLMCGAINSARV
jgi:DNA-binding XRE family transcriptional regulator